MTKHKFLDTLQQRAVEQHIVLREVPFPKVFLFISRQLGEYPWRILIPMAVIFSLFLHVILGKAFDERILWLFGSL